MRRVELSLNGVENLGSGTGAMIALGKVRGNLMIDVNASNKKLRDRAVRLVAELAKCDPAQAAERLEAHGWNVRAALGET